jgi:DNA-binding HxlR family transcriptional regulator
MISPTMVSEADTGHKQTLAIAEAEAGEMRPTASRLFDEAHPVAANPDRMLQLLERRWVLVILARLCGQPLGFTELQRAIPEVSTKMMVERLRDLQDCGLVERTKFPKRTKYTLTASGQALRPAVSAIFEWASMM